MKYRRFDVVAVVVVIPMCYCVITVYYRRCHLLSVVRVVRETVRVEIEEARE